jgi:hypothetical protein
MYEGFKLFKKTFDTEVQYSRTELKLDLFPVDQPRPQGLLVMAPWGRGCQSIYLDMPFCNLVPRGQLFKSRLA